MTSTPLTSTYVIFLSLYWNAFALHGQMDSLTMHVAGHFPIIVMLQLNKKSECVISADDIFIVSTQQLRKKAETYFPGNSLIRAPTITRCQQREKTIRQIYCRFRTRRPPDYYLHTFFCSRQRKMVRGQIYLWEFPFWAYISFYAPKSCFPNNS